MGEHRSIDEVMGGHDIVPASTEGTDTGSLTTADMAGVGQSNVTATRPEAVDTSSDMGTAPTDRPLVRASQPSPDAPPSPPTTPAPPAPQSAAAVAASTPVSAPAPTSSARQEQEQAPLFAADRAESFRSRWMDIQTGFVDEPRRAVEQADSLVAEVMQQLARTFADERSGLENQWGHGGDISTEDLRMALRRYRSFFDRLLSI